jgi:hypothetical protein
LIGDDVEVGGTGEQNWFLADQTDWTCTVHSNVRTQLLFQDTSTQPETTYHLFVDTGNAELFGQEQDAGCIELGANNEIFLTYQLGGNINSFWLETNFLRSVGEENVG